MIYLIRHGQTQFNREDRFQGRVDSPLTELGVAQAQAIGARLKELADADPGDWAIQTSPLGRAIQTSQIIAGIVGLPGPTIEPRLIEVSYGDMEGLGRAEIDERWPELIGVTGVFGRAPGGETIEALCARVGAWLADHPSERRRLVAVTHAGVVRAARGLYAGLGVEAMRAMDKPQDAFFRLHEGRVERLECPPLPSGALGR
ncbi:MAG: histidine phosphatase family protein [Caulobacterales bacterium]